MYFREMRKVNTFYFSLFLLLCLGCNRLHFDNKEYFFISSTSELDRENELIVNMDSVFVHRFVLKAPYSHYEKLLSDSLRSNNLPDSENGNPFLMLRYTIIDSAKEDIFITDLNVHVSKLYDSIPGDKLPVHEVYTGYLNKSISASKIISKVFSSKDTIRIKAGTTNPLIFMTADYDLKDHLDDATFLLRTQMTIKYKNAYNMVDLYDTIVRHDRYE